jgi:S-adenosylmethionine-diacylglycerol 3-amino-3-carboxypropyl transferase
MPDDTVGKALSGVFAGGGLPEKLFGQLFRGLVYPQIWEDPEIDMEALAITPRCHVMTIASGGCNVLSYLIAGPARITALDLSKAHVALNRLKLAAVQHLPSAEAFYHFFGDADEAGNVAAYWRFIAPHLDARSREYWESRTAFGLGRRRVSAFSRNFYRSGLLGRSIGLGHLIARLYGVEPAELLKARNVDEQRNFFDTVLAPLFDKRLVRWMTRLNFSLYGLGIPPSQHAALAGGAEMANVLRDRVERLSCDFSIDDNYFAWQAFGRRYPAGGQGPLPPYLRRVHFDAIRAGAERVSVLNRSFTEHLRRCADRSVDRYVLLDAQDWMDDTELNALWREITRTARPDARVIFRTAAEPSLLPGRVAPEILAQWRYEEERSKTLGARDRSAVYGGFHLYILEDRP